MLEFFKVFSGVTASFLGVMTAFLISKILNFEEKITMILIGVQDKKNSIGELKIEIKNLKISENSLRDKYEDIFEEISEENLNEVFFSKSKEEKIDLISKVLINKNFFYLNIEKCYQETHNIYIEKWKIEMEEKIVNDEYTDIVSIQEKYPETTKEIEKFHREKYNDLLRTIMQQQKVKDFSQWEKTMYMFRVRNKINDKLMETIRLQKPLNYTTLEEKLEKYVLKIQILNKETLKSNFLKKENKLLKQIITFSFFIFLFGIVYPMSFIKYENEVLNFSLYENFFIELFSLTGSFLLLITIFVLILYFLLGKILKECSYLEKNILKEIEEINFLSEEDNNIENYLEFKKINLNNNLK